MALAIADDQGSLRSVLQGWVHDGAKWRTIQCSYTWNTSRSILDRDVDCIGTIGISISGTTYTSFIVSWNALGAELVDVYVNGTLRTSSSSANGSYTVTGLNPDVTYSTYVIAHSENQDVQSQTRQVTMASIPAPDNLTTSGQTNSTYTLSYSSVPDASRYDIYNADNNQAWYQGGATDVQRGGLTPGGTWRDYVKSVHASGAQSAPSLVKSSSTTAAFPAGGHFFYPTSVNTWQSGARTWRNDADTVHHGDGGIYGAAGGSRYTYYFGYRHEPSGMTIPQFFDQFGDMYINAVALQVRMTRANTANGIASPQPCRWFRHNHPSQPSVPTTYGGASDNGALNRGQGAEINIPAAWAQDLINGNAFGIIWGGYPYYSNGTGYMTAAKALSTRGNGSIIITVG